MKKELIVAAVLGGLCGVSFGQDANVAPAVGGYEIGVSTPVVTPSTATTHAPAKKKATHKKATVPAVPEPAPTNVQ